MRNIKETNNGLCNLFEKFMEFEGGVDMIEAFEKRDGSHHDKERCKSIVYDAIAKLVKTDMYEYMMAVTGIMRAVVFTNKEFTDLDKDRNKLEKYISEIESYDEEKEKHELWLSEMRKKIEPHFGKVASLTVSNRRELMEIVRAAIELYGNKADLNFIDVSDMFDLTEVFKDTDFNGDISKWNTSNVKYMNETFMNSKFNGDISKWDTGNVKWARSTFENSVFNGDISKWNVNKIIDCSRMFKYSRFNRDISEWRFLECADFTEMFMNSAFNRNIDAWDIYNVPPTYIRCTKCCIDMFTNTALESNHPKWLNEKNFVEKFHDALASSETDKKCKNASSKNKRHHNPCGNACKCKKNESGKQTCATCK